jgi:hypothetical protein
MREIENCCFLRRHILVIVFLLSVASISYGANMNWTNSDGGLFSEIGNWDSGVPGSSDYALFPLSDDYTVDFSSSVTNNGLYFTAGGGTLSLNVGSGNEYYLANTSDAVLLQSTYPALLHLISGKMIFGGQFYLGKNTGQNSNRFMMSGSDTVLENRSAKNFYVGYFGNDNFATISGGAVLVVTNGGGSVVVGERSFSSGNRLEVTDGSKVFSSYHFSIGNNTSANSNSVFLSGSDSVLSNPTSAG